MLTPLLRSVKGFFLSLFLCERLSRRLKVKRAKELKLVVVDKRAKREGVKGT